VREIIYIRLSSSDMRVERQAGRLVEKAQEVYTSRKRGATSSGRIPTKLCRSFRRASVINDKEYRRSKISCIDAAGC